MAMNKSVQRASVNHLAYVLELLGSFLYIVAAVFILASFSGIQLLPSPILYHDVFWLPLFYSVAIVGTILLFIVSFTNLMHSRSSGTNKYVMAVSVITGIAWVGLAAGNLMLSVLVILGFAVSAVGGSYGMISLADSDQ